MSNSTFIEEERPKGFWQERYEELYEKYDQLLKSKDAPDKIYVPQHNIKAENIQELDELIVAGSTEYIRKDTLVDKLYKWLEEETSVADYYSEKQFKKAIDNLF